MKTRQLSLCYNISFHRRHLPRVSVIFVPDGSFVSPQIKQLDMGFPESIDAGGTRIIDDARDAAAAAVSGSKKRCQ